ncbi:hypothetical protein BDF19DRAFT_420684 [Syncephalis fuscata]|nr:hypothetical protein BDF19DRAFT_420684 [Syncephalis fuscata]
MPVFYNNDQLGTKWLVNATYVLGIPLHPLGEIDPSVLIERESQTKTPKDCLEGLQRQVLINIVLAWIFFNNLGIAFKMIKSRPRVLSGWFCIISPIFGITWVMCVMLAMSYIYLTCRMAIWYLAFGLAISSMCNSAIILQKAYLILLRKRWRGCTFYYPYYLPWIWMGIEAPSQLMFTTIFAYVAHQQYRMFGSDAWRRLAREGIQVMCLAMLCKLVCGAIIIFDAFGDLSEIFVLVDWVTSSTILIRHCNGTRRATLSSCPKTTHTPNIPQTETANEFSLADN